MPLSPLSSPRRSRKMGRFVAYAVVVLALAAGGSWYVDWWPMSADTAGEAKGEGKGGSAKGGRSGGGRNQAVSAAEVERMDVRQTIQKRVGKRVFFPEQ